MQVSYKLESLCKAGLKNRKRWLKLPVAYYFSLPRKSVSSPARKAHQRITAVSELPKHVNACSQPGTQLRGKTGNKEKAKTTKPRKSQVASPAPFFTMSHKKRKKPLRNISGIISCWRENFLHKQNHTAPSFDILQVNKEIKAGPCNLSPLAQLLLCAFTFTDRQLIQSLNILFLDAIMSKPKRTLKL